MQTRIQCLMLLTLVCQPLAAMAGRLNVVATTSDFGAIAREIGGDRVVVTVLAQPGEDPHFVTPKPSYFAKLGKADVLIEGGAELETGWLPPLLDGARNSRLAVGQPGHVACAEGLALLEVPAVLDRAQGDIHAMGNPHYMTDPLNARAVASRICDCLCSVDPVGAAAYREACAAFVKRLDEKLVAWRKLLEPHRGAHLVAYHNSWPYFARCFGLTIDLFLEPKPGIPPSPAHLAGVVEEMKVKQARVVIVEPFQNRKTAEKVAGRTGAKVVDFTQYPGGMKGAGPGYIELMDKLVESLSVALSGLSESEKE